MPLQWRGWCGVGLLLLAPGCSSSRSREARSDWAGDPSLTQPPVFLTAPLGQLFTNADGFSGRVTLETRRGLGQVEVVTGELLGRGTELLFAPQGEGTVNQRLRAAGGVFFVWNVAEHRGLVLNEALQGYARLDNPVALSNLVAQPQPGPTADTTLEGHPCQAEQITMTLGDSPPQTYTVWRATDLKGLPLVISSATNSVLFKLHLAKARLERPSEDLFRPPAGFTSYDSPQAMMGELTVRRQSSRRQEGSSLPEPKPGDQWNDHTRHPN